jgi:hypothetical protein
MMIIITTITKYVDNRPIFEICMAKSSLRKELKKETGSEIFDAQDQALNTKYYATKIIKTANKWRICQKLDETVEHRAGSYMKALQCDYYLQHT